MTRQAHLPTHLQPPAPTRFPFPLPHQTGAYLGAARRTWAGAAGAKTMLTKPPPPETGWGGGAGRLTVLISLLFDTESLNSNSFLHEEFCGGMGGIEERANRTGGRAACSGGWVMQATRARGNAIQMWSQNPSGRVHTTCFSCFAIRRLGVRVDDMHACWKLCLFLREAARAHRDPGRAG